MAASNPARSNPNVKRMIASLKDKWRPLAGLGGGLMLLGILMMAAPSVATRSVELILGIALLLSAAGIFSHAFAVKDWDGRALEIVLGVISLAAGGFLVLRPVESAQVLTLVIAGYFIFDGVVRGILANKMKPISGWFWFMLGGALSIVIGILLLMAYPTDSLWILGWLAGLNFLFSGLLILLFGLGLRTAASV